MPQLLQYYIKCKLVSMEAAWNSFDSSSLNAHEGNPLTSWLPSFYDEILLLFSTEVYHFRDSLKHYQASWATKIFADRDAVIASLMKETLTQFAEPLKQRLEKYIVQVEDKHQKLDDLITAFSITFNFAKSTCNIIPNSSGIAESRTHSLLRCDKKRCLNIYFSALFSLSKQLCNLGKRKIIDLLG